MIIDLPNDEATAALGARLWSQFLDKPRGVIYLRGDLGAGKTTLARGILRAAGISGTLRSPTYTLMEPYAAQNCAFLHLDLYRLTDAEEVAGLGLSDYPPENTLWLVEWPEQGLGFLPPADLEVSLEHRGAARSATLSGRQIHNIQL